MLLPGFSMNDFEAEERKKKEALSRTAAALNEKAADKEQAASSTSGVNNAIQKMINRMNRPAEEKIDYLTPARKEREHAAVQRRNHTVDFNLMKQKALVKRAIINR